MTEELINAIILIHTACRHIVLGEKLNQALLEFSTFPLAFLRSIASDNCTESKSQLCIEILVSWMS